MFDEKVQELKDNFPLDDLDKGWFALAELLSAIGYLANEFYKRHEHNIDTTKEGLGTDTSWSGSFEHSTYALGIGPNSKKMKAILHAGYEMKGNISRDELVKALNALQKAKDTYEDNLVLVNSAIDRLEGEI